MTKVRPKPVEDRAMYTKPGCEAGEYGTIVDVVKGCRKVEET